MSPLYAEFLGMTGPELKDFSIFVGGIIVMVLQYLNNRRMNKVQTDVHRVEIATNSMKDQLVLKTEAEALARGGIEERQRADDKVEKSGGIVQATIKQDIKEILEKQEVLPKEVVEEIKKEIPGVKP